MLSDFSAKQNSMISVRDGCDCKLLKNLVTPYF